MFIALYGSDGAHLIGRLMGALRPNFLLGSITYLM